MARRRFRRFKRRRSRLMRRRYGGKRRMGGRRRLKYYQTGIKMPRVKSVGALFPQKLRMKCRAQTDWVLNTANAGFQGEIIVKLNSLYLPFLYVDGAGAAAGSADTFQQLAGPPTASTKPYALWRVYGARVRIQIMNGAVLGLLKYRGIADPVATDGTVHPTDPLYAVTWQQNLPTVNTIIGSNGAQNRPTTVLNRYFSIPKTYGVSDTEFWANAIFCGGGVATNPAATLWWNSQVFSNTGALLAVSSAQYRVTCVYYVQFEYRSQQSLP